MSNRSKAKAPSDRLDTGIKASDRRMVAEELGKVLANTYLLMLKSHVYHWNVVGPLFVPFHELTEQHYRNLFDAADLLAERIRALGERTPLSFNDFAPQATISEESRDRDAMAMVESLVDDHERITQHLRDAAKAAEEADDLVTTDLLTERMAFHEKAIWMLRAIAGK